jgi:outer membrane receptor protein involved in Fe transport
MKIVIFQSTKEMKILLAFFSLLSASCVANGQINPSKSVIKGTVTDSLKSTSMAFATISLLDKKSNKLVKNTLSKEDGSFEFDGFPQKTYLLQIASIGYQTKTITLPSFPKVGAPVIDAGFIKLATETTGMNEVIVSTTVKKPLIKQEVDRISYDVQADPESSGISVLDMLRKVPLLSVDATDNIKLKGNTNFKILINGQPSALIAQNPSDIFKAMPASNILRIEVITTPPAKYDAEGLAGIINIITKKKIGDGYNGNISTSYNSVYGPRINVGGTVKEDKFGANGYVGFQIPNKQVLNNGYTNNVISPYTTYLSQQGTSTIKNKNPYGSLELSYEIDTLNLLTANVNTYHWISNQTNSQVSSLQDSINGGLLQSYNLLNSQNNQYQGTDLSFNYQRGFKNNKERLLTISYKYNMQGYTSSTIGDYTQQSNDSTPSYSQYNNEGTKEHTIQLDYVHPIKKLTIEAGGKAILRTNYSEFNYNNYDSLTQKYINDSTQTNDFDYKQNVLSAYNSYELKLNKFVVKAGLRLEHTSINAKFTSVDTPFTQQYNNFIPSISLQRKFNGNNSVSVGFTNRIQRPSIWQLNPFVNRSNPEAISFGNPNLQPVLNHSIELNYSYFAKGSINIGLSYSFANNTIENVMTINPDTTTQTTYKNIGKNDRLGLSLNSNYPITKKLNFNINSMLLHIWLKGTLNGEFYSQSGFQGYCFTSTSYNFPHDYHASLDAGYDSRYVLLQGRDNYYFNLSFGGSKDFLNKKASISLYVMNPYEKYRKIDNYINTNTFNQYDYHYEYARRFNLTFRYKFGHLNSEEIKKTEKAVNNDDTNDGRGH